MSGATAVAAEQGDIGAREDVVRLVRAFYARAMSDDRIGYIFTEVAQLDLEAHLPVMFDFWETLLLGTRSYSGGAMQKHLELNRRSPLLPEHFERWLQLFEETVDSHFAGEKAEEAKVKARYIGRSMQLRMSAAQMMLQTPPAR